MLELLRAREYANESAYSTQCQLTNQRNASLSISIFRDVESKHQGGVVSLDIEAAENRYLLSGGSDGQIGIYDMLPVVTSFRHSHPAICFIDGEHSDVHKTSVSCVSWYPHDSGIFLSCGTDKLLKVWDTNKLVVAEEHSFNGIAYCVSMSPLASTHSLAAVSTEKSEINLVDLKSGSRSHTLRGHEGPVLCAQWSRGDEFIMASGGKDGRVMLWDIRKSQACLLMLDKDNHRHLSADIRSGRRAHSGRVNGLNFTSDGRHIVTMGTDYRLRLWSAQTGRKRAVDFGHHDCQSRRLVQLSSGGSVIFAPEGADIQAYDVNSGDLMNTLVGHFTTSNCCIYNESRQELYSGGNDRNILVYTPDGRAERRYKDYLEGGEERKTVAEYKDEWSSDSDDDSEDHVT